ncbi:MAG: undecaprenyl-phosphate glucose phosphotransferase [Muribaculaceae bacterium]|nr:undecaprenyl-phosphate glucose phosphotransferase [Muribaculaceae bacterium]
MTKRTIRNYGNLIPAMVVIFDFIVLNCLFLTTCLLFTRPEDQFFSRPVMMLVNLAYLPTVYHYWKVRVDRTIHMDRVVFTAFKAVIIHLVAFSLLCFAVKFNQIPLRTFGQFYGILAVGMPLWWAISRGIIKSMRRRGRNRRNIIIIGTRTTAQRLRDQISDLSYGYNFLGFVDEEKPEEIDDNDFLCTINELEETVKRMHNIDDIYFTISGEKSNLMPLVTRICDNNFINFFYVLRISRFLSRHYEMSQIGTMPVAAARPNPLSRISNRIIKRLFDVVVSSIFLIFFPLILIPVAIAIKISSPGPIFFKQKRTGFMGEEFNCWKFRTMRVNKDADKKQATKDDSRKTKVGTFLRKTSIDELPQFINVWLGDMSIVGPRPHMLTHTEQYARLIDQYMVRHFIKPGITGWAQVNGYRGQTEELWQMEKRVEYDVWYIENWNFFLDIKIMVKTIINAVKGEENAF